MNSPPFREPSTCQRKDPLMFKFSMEHCYVNPFMHSEVLHWMPTGVVLGLSLVLLSLMHAHTPHKGEGRLLYIITFTRKKMMWKVIPLY